MGYTFKLEKKRSHIFKKLVETLAGVVDETILVVNPNEFLVTAIDPGRNCLLKLQMTKDVFSKFKCTKDEIYKTGVNLSDLDKIMKRCTGEDSIEFSFDERENRIKISMKRTEHRQRTFSLAEVDVDFEELPIDKLLEHEYEAGFNIEPELFDEAVKDAGIYSEIITIKAIKDKGISFSSSGQIGEMNYNVDLEDLESSEIDKNCTAVFGLTFLKNIFKVSSITKSLTIAVSNDHPMAMIINLEGGGILYYLVAPRVEYEEDYEEE